MSKQAYLAFELEHNIKHFDKESTHHKRMYRRLRHAAFALSAISTILAGLALAYPQWQADMNVAILVTSTLIGLASSIEGLRRPQELWVHERSVLYDLRDVQRDLAYQQQEGATTAQVDELYARMQSILQSSREKWRQGAAKPKPDQPPQPG